MTHDPLCPYRPDVAVDYGEWIKGKPCYCGLIAKVREHERNKFLPAHWSQDWHLGYRQGVADTEKRFRDRK